MALSYSRPVRARNNLAHEQTNETERDAESAGKSFHEKAGECQGVLSFFLSSSLSLFPNDSH
jgi:hypothetical protein